MAIFFNRDALFFDYIVELDSPPMATFVRLCAFTDGLDRPLLRLRVERRVNVQTRLVNLHRVGLRSLDHDALQLLAHLFYEIGAKRPVVLAALVVHSES